MFRPKNGFIETIRKAENEKAEKKSGKQKRKTKAEMEASLSLSLSLSLFSLLSSLFSLLSLSLSQVHMQTRVFHPADQAKQVEERPRVRVDHKDLAGLRGPVSESRALEILQQHRPEVSSEVFELLGPSAPT